MLLLFNIVAIYSQHLQLDRYQQKVLKRENSIAVLCKTKVARMLFIIVTAFVLLHIPFAVVVFGRETLLQNAIMNQVEGGLYALSCVSHYFLYLNAAINPIIYGLTNDNFRRAYHQTPIVPRFKQATYSSKVTTCPYTPSQCISPWHFGWPGMWQTLIQSRKRSIDICHRFVYIFRLLGAFGEETKLKNSTNCSPFDTGN